MTLRTELVEAVAQAMVRRMSSVNWNHLERVEREYWGECAEAALDAALDKLGDRVAEWHEAADELDGGSMDGSPNDSLPADLLAVLRP